MVPDRQKVRTDGRKDGRNGRTDGRSQNYIPPTSSGNNYRKMTIKWSFSYNSFAKLSLFKMVKYTVKSLLQEWASIRTITVHGDGGGPLLEATSA